MVAPHQTPLSLLALVFMTCSLVAAGCSKTEAALLAPNVSGLAATATARPDAVPAFADEKDDSSAGGMGRLRDRIVIHLENHSFDNLYREFSGANGHGGGVGVNSQRDLAGTIYGTLPPVPDTNPFGPPLAAIAHEYTLCATSSTTAAKGTAATAGPGLRRPGGG